MTLLCLIHQSDEGQSGIVQTLQEAHEVSKTSAFLTPNESNHATQIFSLSLSGSTTCSLIFRWLTYLRLRCFLDTVCCIWWSFKYCLMIQCWLDINCHNSCELYKWFCLDVDAVKAAKLFYSVRHLVVPKDAGQAPSPLHIESWSCVTNLLTRHSMYWAYGTVVNKKNNMQTIFIDRLSCISHPSNLESSESFEYLLPSLILVGWIFGATARCEV